MGFTSVVKPHLLASYKAAYCIAEAMKPQTLGEDVIKPCAIDMKHIILGDRADREIELKTLHNTQYNRKL